MISDKALLKFLNDNSLNCPAETLLLNILNEELAKPEEEMDTDLVDYCLDTLEKFEEQEKNSDTDAKEAELKDKKGTHHFKRILIIAAVLSVLIAGAFSVSAVFPEVKIFDGIVEFYNEHIRVRYDKGSDNAAQYGLLGSQLAKELETNGITPIVLPEILLTDDYRLSEVTYEKFDAFLAARINFNNDTSKIKGFIDMYQYEEKKLLPAIDFQGVDDSVKLTVSGIDVYVFNQKQGVSITYQDGNTQYDIVLSDNVSIDTAFEFAKTIK